MQIVMSLLLVGLPLIDRTRRHRWPWAFIYLATGLSAAFNAIAVENTDAIGRVTHALMPCFLAISFHGFTYLLERLMIRPAEDAHTLMDAPMSASIDDAHTPTESVDAPIEATRTPMGVAQALTHEVRTTVHAERVEMTHAVSTPIDSPIDDAHTPMDAPTVVDAPATPAGLPTERPAILAAPASPVFTVVHNNLEPTADALDPEPAGDAPAKIDRAAIVNDLCWRRLSEDGIMTRPDEWRAILDGDHTGVLAGYARPDKALPPRIRAWQKLAEKQAA
jgi:hypothetical protein